MKVLYDYQGFIQKIGGVSRYHCELLNNLPSVGVTPIIPNIYSDNVYLSALGIKHRHGFTMLNASLRNNVYKWIDQKISLHALSAGDYDVFHPTFLNPYYVGHTGNKPVVVTIHDLNHEKFPQFDSHVVTEKRKKILETCDHVIAISQQTKDDLMNLYHFPENSITVIYHGIDQSILNTNSDRLHERPYILYVGGRNSYKNFNNFLRAFALLKEDIDLVCTGNPFTKQEMQSIYKLGVVNRVSQLFVSDEEMNQLMAQALVFVYPSIGEGFGMPILEAYRCGCPCVISDIPCFHEVAADAAIYFNPSQPDSISQAISGAINDSDLLHLLRQKGYERIKKFPWSKTVEEVAKVYKSFK
jgi:glycosyltransferase involved in cell wall biosynthesis